MTRFLAVDPTTNEYANIVCRQLGHDPKSYNVYVGDTCIGRVANGMYEGWSAISHADSLTVRGWRMTRGFKTRWFAIEYLLRAYGIWGGGGSYAPPVGQEYVGP